MPVPQISVVIPTTGRDELSRAVASARAQTGDLHVEIVVVVDAAEGALSLPPSVTREADLVVWTGGSAGGSNARNLGVSQASGEFIAFLDDDDEWKPEKLSRQLPFLRGPSRSGTVVSSRHVHREAGSGRVSSAMPNRTIADGQDVADYLFRNRRPAGGRASLYTSSLLCRRELVLRVPWDGSLRRHQDWDWLVRVSQTWGGRVVQAPEALVWIQTGSSGSISAGKSWVDSLAWAERVLAPSASRRVFVDFVTAQTLRYAMAARSWRGVRLVIGAIGRAGALPSAGPIVIAAGGLLPRRFIERIMIAVK